MFVETFQVAVKKLIAFIKGKAWTTKRRGSQQKRQYFIIFNSVSYFVNFLFAEGTRDTARG